MTLFKNHVLKNVSMSGDIVWIVAFKKMFCLVALAALFHLCSIIVFYL